MPDNDVVHKWLMGYQDNVHTNDFRLILFDLTTVHEASTYVGCKRVDGSMPHKHWCSAFFLLCVLICFLLIFSLRDTKRS